MQHGGHRAAYGWKMTAPEAPDYGIYRCVTGATIPKAQRTAGQPCPFCGRTLSLTPTVQDKTSKRKPNVLMIVLVVFVVVPFFLIAAALFLGAEISDKFSEVGSGSDPDERVAAFVENEFGRTLSATDIIELKARVAELDTLTTCYEFFEYLDTEIAVGVVSAEEGSVEGVILGAAVAEYSDGTSRAFIEDCTAQLTINAGGTRHGDDPTLDPLWDECEVGVFESCDLLFLIDPGLPESEYRAFGGTCGDRSPGETDWCMVSFGEGIDTEAWRGRCRAGDYAACDLLFQFTSAGTDDQLLASTCGHTTDELYIGCVLKFGL